MKEINLTLYLFDGLSTQREIASDFKTEIDCIYLVEYILKMKRKAKKS